MGGVGEPVWVPRHPIGPRRPTRTERLHSWFWSRIWARPLTVALFLALPFTVGNVVDLAIYGGASVERATVTAVKQAPPDARCPKGDSARSGDTRVTLRSEHAGPGLPDTFTYVDCSVTDRLSVGQTVTVRRRGLLERHVSFGGKVLWWTIPLPELVFGSVAVAGTFVVARVRRRLRPQ